MAHLIEQLIEAKIRNIKSPGLYADGRGLYLQVRGAGALSWIYRFTLNGRTRDMGLGALAEVGLVAARAKAAECRSLQAKGIDPIEQASTARTGAKITIAGASGPTFREAAEAYMDEKLKLLRNPVHRQQWRSSLQRFAYPIIGDLSAANIGTPEVLLVLRPIWESRCETAMRLRGRIERILARETVEGRRTGSNPATWRGHLQEALPKRSEVRAVVHHPAMKYSEIPAFMAALGARPELSAAALRFLILTATRTGETIGARWIEIDLNDQTWTIPGARTKTAKEHIVPLSNGAIDVLREVQPLREVGSGFIFPSTKGHGLSQVLAAETGTFHQNVAFATWQGSEP
jgi:integrase